MKTRVQNLFLTLACTGLLAMPAAAQTFTTLYSFTGGNDGAGPNGSLILSGNILYGTASGGGSGGGGTVFAVNINGTGFTNLYTFTLGSGQYNSIYWDGANPQSGLILSGNILYGTAEYGGFQVFPHTQFANNGTVFAINTDGTNATTVYNFTPLSAPSIDSGINGDGANPYAGLILSSNTLYGTTYDGGSSAAGTVFAVNTNIGTGCTTLHSFNGVSDGGFTKAGLILSGNTLYGTAPFGGSGGSGTVFAVNTDGSGFTTLYSFTNGGDGANPEAGLIISGNTLYGTTYYGGSAYAGMVFAINTNGSNFTTLYSFTNGNDGANPFASLILSGNTLYGTAEYGGTNGAGTVFAINTNGSDFMTLYSFTNGSDGANPVGGLILSGNTLYGTARDGGSSGYGTVFALSLPVPSFGIINLDFYWPSYPVYETPYGPGAAAIGNSGDYWNGLNLLSYPEVVNGLTNNYGVATSVGINFSSSAGGAASSGGGTYANLFDSYANFTTSSQVDQITGLTPNAQYYLYVYSPNTSTISVNGVLFSCTTAPRPENSLVLGIGYSENIVTADASGNLNISAPNGYPTGNLSAMQLTPVPPPAPTLSIALTNGVVISWPSPSTGFVLQQNADLTTTNWTTTGYTITTANGTNSITITPPTGNLFFRLSNP